MSTELIDKVKSRGPTCWSQMTTDNGIHCLSSVLSLRQPLTEQPVVSQDPASVLMYNGEIYGVSGCDTVSFSDSLKNGVISGLRNVSGEYAFAYVIGNTVWFGRDCIGRRSLLYRVNDDGQFAVASVTDHVIGQPDLWKQCRGGVVYELNVDTLELQEHVWGYSDDTGNALTYPFNRVSKGLAPSEKNVATTSFAAEFEALLVQAVLTRTQEYSQISILFSGGIDCALLARLADLHLPSTVSIELVNVAFENPRVGEGFDTPDRLLGRSTFRELTHLSTQNRLLFKEVNVPYAETLEHREGVRALMYPSTSVMDLSIAVAFYFASKACSSAVVVSGLGADELFGGYSRIVQSLASGYDAVAESLQVEFSRLHERNLGRDDRVIAQHGKEARYPFLDEKVVAWAMDCPIDLKLSGTSDADTKYLLRLVARNVGLKGVSYEKKRAIQFGARSAKMEVGSGKVKGHEVF